jgi:hypothetical protein
MKLVFFATLAVFFSAVAAQKYSEPVYSPVPPGGPPGVPGPNPGPNPSGPPHTTAIVPPSETRYVYSLNYTLAKIFNVQ